MQLPSVDRTPTLRPAGAVAVSPAANRVIPVAPVNPSVSQTRPAEQTPGVINLVNTAHKPNEGEPVYTSVSDPARRGSEAATASKDWTIHRPAPEKVEDPPPKPMSQILMDHLRTMWTAGASAIQLEQTKDQLTPAVPVNPSVDPGTLAKESVTYLPTKIKKNEKL